jgi:hypothetical protein
MALPKKMPEQIKRSYERWGRADEVITLKYHKHGYEGYVVVLRQEEGERPKGDQWKYDHSTRTWKWSGITYLSL